MCISQKQVDELEKLQAEVKVENYHFNIDEKVDQVRLVSDQLVKKLLKLIPLDAQTMKLTQMPQIVTSDDPCLASKQIV